VRPFFVERIIGIGGSGMEDAGMSAKFERRALQVAIGLACLVPFAAGLQGALQSAAMLKGVDAPLPIDLDSHYRYLSGLLLGIGIGFAACLPRIEARGSLFRALALIVFVGGLARLYGATLHGLPGPGHVFGLLMELLVVPIIAVWQARIARLLGGASLDQVAPAS